MQAEPAGPPQPFMPQPFIMTGADGELCVDGVCAVPSAPLGSPAPAGTAPLERPAD